MTGEQRGVTLLEILLAMLIFALVASGVFTAFVFSRKVSWRSETEIMVQSHVQRIMEKLRLAVTGDLADGTTLTPGYYVDAKMTGAPNSANGTVPIAVAWLNFPLEMQRFQTANGEGIYLFVEKSDENADGIADEDYDNDGLIGKDFNGDHITDAKRVRVRVRWTVPNQ